MSKAKAKVAVKKEEEEEDVEVEAEETEDVEENGAEEEENGDDNEDEEADAQSQASGKSSQSKKSKQSKKSNARNKKADKSKSKKKAVKVVRRAEKQPAGSDDGDNAAGDDLAEDMDGANLDDEVKDDGYRHCTGVLTSRPTAKDVKISNFAMAAYGQQLILDATLEFSIGRRYGLIGPNGSGKSSLLRSLANREVPIPHHIDIFLLEEEAKPSEMTALEAVIASVEEKMKIYEEEAEKAIEEFGPDSDVVTDLYNRLEELDPTTFKARAGKILFGLGFDNVMMEKKTKDMSGGWRMRVALAQALFAKPTLLLLDEPTNHLDLEACVWLENYLSQYDRCLVVVSHSQDFLNGVCTNIIHITPKRKLQVYGGNYDTFIQVKTENEANQMKRYKKEQEDIKHIKSFIASCGTYSNLVRQGKSKQKIIDKMVAAGLTEAVIQEAKFNFKFPEVEQLPPPILAFDDVSFAYSGEYKDALYHHLNVGVQMDSRIALVGPNGAGKSTLLKLMAGDLAPTVGTVRRHLNLVIGRYHQHSTDQLEENMTPLDYIRKVYADRKLGEEDWRQHLGKFGVSGKMQTSLIRKMSDGQKSRLVFSLMSVLRPHLLLFDEPTNHLDIECIDSLAAAINEFQGGMVLVSHDFRLISQVAKQVWVCDKKTITTWQGDIRSYKQSLMAKMNLH